MMKRSDRTNYEWQPAAQPQKRQTPNFSSELPENVIGRIHLRRPETNHEIFKRSESENRDGQRCPRVMLVNSTAEGESLSPVDGDR